MQINRKAKEQIVLISISIVVLVVLMIFTPLNALGLQNSPNQPIVSSISSSISSVSSILSISNSTQQKFTYAPHFRGKPVTDVGKFSGITALNGFSWNTTSSQSLKLGIPVLVVNNNTVSFPSSQIYSNSTSTQYRLSGFASTSSLSDYFISVTFKPNNYTTKISIDGFVGIPATLEIPFSSTGFGITWKAGSTIISAGVEQFSWSDIPITYSPTWNNSTATLSLLLNGGFHIDPLAIDGTGHCATGATNTCNISLTTSASPDLIVVILACSSGGGCGGYSVSDTASLSYSLRLCVGGGGNTCASVNGLVSVAEYTAVASGTLSGDTITGTQTGNVNGRISIVAYGISGANTGSPFDSNAAVPCSNSDGGTPSATFSCPTISTSNANDMIIGSSGSSNPAGSSSLSPGSGYTIAICNGQFSTTDGDGSACSEYQIVSSTQSGLSVSISSSITASWAFIGDAIKSAGTTVNQIINISTNNGAPSATITISGCSYSNGTFTADGFNHHYTPTSSCTTTLTNPADGSCATFVSTCTRYRFDISPKPTASTTLTFSTCSTGTCSNYINITYYQLRNNYTETASPKWDARYDDTCLNNIGSGNAFCNGYNSPSGTFVGGSLPISTADLCSRGGGVLPFMVTNQGAQSGYCSAAFRGTMWCDYNVSCCLPSMIGNTWVPSNANCFTDTTAGNAHSTTYVQSSGGGITLGYTPAIIVLSLVMIGAFSFLFINGKRNT